jgi:hypothetical protein
MLTGLPCGLLHGMPSTHVPTASTINPPNTHVHSPSPNPQTPVACTGLNCSNTQPPFAFTLASLRACARQASVDANLRQQEGARTAVHNPHARSQHMLELESPARTHTHTHTHSHTYTHTHTHTHTSIIVTVWACFPLSMTTLTAVCGEGGGGARGGARRGGSRHKSQ